MYSITVLKRISFFLFQHFIGFNISHSIGMGTQELQNGNKSIFTNIFTEIQGWEFAHRFSKRIARVQK